MFRGTDNNELRLFLYANYFFYILGSQYYTKAIIIYCNSKKSPPSYLYTVHNVITFNRNFLLEVNCRNYVHIMSCTAIMLRQYMVINGNIEHICTFHCVWHEVNIVPKWNLHEMASLLTFVNGFPYAFVIMNFIIQNWKYLWIMFDMSYDTFQ